MRHTAARLPVVQAFAVVPMTERSLIRVMHVIDQADVLTFPQRSGTTERETASHGHDWV